MPGRLAPASVRRHPSAAGRELVPAPLSVRRPHRAAVQACSPRDRLALPDTSASVHVRSTATRAARSPARTVELVQGFGSGSAPAEIGRLGSFLCPSLAAKPPRASAGYHRALSRSSPRALLPRPDPLDVDVRHLEHLSMPMAARRRTRRRPFPGTQLMPVSTIARIASPSSSSEQARRHR